ncbi:MAG: rhomboid family intramembrane serine protease [Chitinophagales bacterium]
MIQSILIISIIALTAITSFLAFNNRVIYGSAIFYPFAVRERGEWYRFITSGFIHADIMHLAINMFVLYSFGEILERYYLPALFGNWAKLFLVFLYFGGMIAADIPAYFRHRHDATYRALGASGAVSAVLFAVILIGPFQGSIRLFFLPIDIPPLVFGVLYLLYSAFMARRRMDNVGHEAHLVGALFGFIVPGLFKPELFTLLFHHIQNRL